MSSMTAARVLITTVEDEAERPAGEGILIHPLLVLVRPPLSEELAQQEGAPPHFRVIFPEAETSREVAGLHVSKRRLVGMDLRESAPTRPVELRLAEDRDEAARQLQRLAESGQLVLGPPGGDKELRICDLFPNAWFCRTHPDGPESDGPGPGPGPLR
jgi:hypothetical protein